jgi:hypothetical protein
VAPIKQAVSAYKMAVVNKRIDIGAITEGIIAAPFIKRVPTPFWSVKFDRYLVTLHFQILMAPRHRSNHRLKKPRGLDACHREQCSIYLKAVRRYLCSILLALMALGLSADAKTVKVRGYYRKNGTYVRPHTRKAPKTRKKRSSGVFWDREILVLSNWDEYRNRDAAPSRNS